MAEDHFLSNQFLVAMPGLDNTVFGRTVSLICEHRPSGAMGLVVNRPTELKLSTMLDHLELERGGLDQDADVFWGGPVQNDRGFVIHNEAHDWESCMRIDDDLHVTTSRDILMAIGHGEGPSNYLVVLGYAGWGEEQLEQEMLSNSWLNTPVSNEIVFKLPPPDRWLAATRLLGLDVTGLASTAGHA